MTTVLSDYQTKYESIRLERDSDGILLVTLHTDGGPCVWSGEVHHEVTCCLGDIAADRENEIVILTGSGETFIADEDLTGVDMSADTFVTYGFFEARKIMMNHLDIEVPMIAAINGPTTMHADLAVLCDIVLATETTTIADKGHFPIGLVPGDGAHVIWPALLGPNRGRYFLLTGQELSAQQALELGVVAEVLPADELLTRSYELARRILQQPRTTRRLVRHLATRELQRQMQENLGLGILAEGLAFQVSGFGRSSVLGEQPD